MNAALILSKIETEMLTNLVKLLRTGNVDDQEWQLQKLQQLGKLRSVNLSMIKKERAKLIVAVHEEIESVANERAKMVDDQTKGAGKLIGEVLPVDTDPQLKAVISKWESTVVSSFDSTFAPMLSKCDAVYTDTIYKAVAKAQMGVSSRQAIAEACSEWSQQGLKALTDNAGRTWTTEAYAQMVVRTNTTSTATETQFARMSELGEDLVEISSHLGARPKCEPYQGRIFSLSGKSDKYPWLYDPSITEWGCTVGEIDGLFGGICRHEMYVYNEGTEQTYHPQNKERNESAYKNSQTQRRLERSIREAKRNLTILKETKDTEQINKANSLLKKRQAAMETFISKTGRTRREDREEIY